MGSRPSETRLKNIDKSSRKVRSSSEDHEIDDSSKQNHVLLKVKEEGSADEIQEYAATTMSEMLGWYGYEKMDTGCTRSLNLDHFTSSTDARRKLSQMDVLTNCRSLRSPLPVDSLNSSSLEHPGVPFTYATDSVKDSRLRMTLDSTPLHTASRFLSKNCLPSTCPDNIESCSWCGRKQETCESGRSNSLSYQMVNAVGEFCSEACFAAGRRAVFKRARTCDWCRHARNPVSYVDLQDGESQLQFCSDKCLNQYKMNIFCHETQAHLTLHGLDSISFHDVEKGGLITPELWFRNCQSPLYGSTDDILIVDDYSTFDLASSQKKTTEHKEESGTENPAEPKTKTARRKDSFCIRKREKLVQQDDNKKNARMQVVESETENNSGVTGKLQECCCLLNEDVQCGTSCSGSNTSNPVGLCEKSKKANIYNHSRNNEGRGGNIYVKDLKELQEHQEYNHSERILKSKSWLEDSLNTRMQFKTPCPSQHVGNGSGQSKYRQQSDIFPRMSPFWTMSPMQSDQSESSTHSSSSTLLPPVTVLVPYPVPIPIPIPIPIPASVLDKLMIQKQEAYANNVYFNNKSSECEKLAENGSSASEESELSMVPKIPITKNSSPKLAASTKCCFASQSSSSNNERTDEVLGQEITVKSNGNSARRKKRSNESSTNTSLSSKRRSKSAVG